MISATLALSLLSTEELNAVTFPIPVIVEPLIFPFTVKPPSTVKSGLAPLIWTPYNPGVRTNAPFGDIILACPNPLPTICNTAAESPISSELLILCLPTNTFEPVVAYEPVNDSNEEILALWVVNVCATEELKSPVTDATDADNEVKLALLAENEVATELLKSPVTDATDADKAVWDAALAENDVATEELNSPVTDETDEDNAVILALLAENDVATDALNGWMLPSKLITSFPPLPNRYKVELPLA